MIATPRDPLFRTWCEKVDVSDCTSNSLEFSSPCDTMAVSKWKGYSNLMVWSLSLVLRKLKGNFSLRRKGVISFKGISSCVRHLHSECVALMLLWYLNSMIKLVPNGSPEMNLCYEGRPAGSTVNFRISRRPSSELLMPKKGLKQVRSKSLLPFIGCCKMNREIGTIS